jgi:hypothetical protein
VGAQASYLSQNSLIESFGLGGAALVDTLEVTWPNGRKQIATAIPARRLIRVVEGKTITP